MLKKSLELLLFASLLLVVHTEEYVATTTRLSPSRRPTRYSDAPFYDIFTRVSGRMRPSSTVSVTRTRQTSVKPKPTRRPPPIVRYKDVQQVEICTASVENYHVIISPTSIKPAIAEGICAGFGWQYAIPPEDDYQLVQWAIGNCTSFSSGIKAYDGYYTGGCQFTQQGYFLMKLDDNECEAAGQFPILCMDTPTTTNTAVVSVAFETTTTVVAKVNGQKKSNTNPEHGSRRIREKTFGDLINGYDVCTSQVNGYHMVYDIFSYSSAAQVCSDLGWNLADIPYDRAGEIVDLFNTCGPFDVMFHINSYDGFVGSHCKFAYVVPWPSVWMVTSNSPLQCSFFELPIICQEDPASVTVQSGTHALTTSTVTELTTTSHATNTVTVTMTE